MVVLVLILALVNIALGFALAVLYDRPFPLPRLVTNDGPLVAGTRLEQAKECEAVASALEPPQIEMPDRWRALLEAFALSKFELVETALWVCIRQCEEARQRITRLDYLQRVGKSDEPFAPAEWDQIVRTCRAWRDDLREALRLITASRTATHADRIVDVLSDYVVQVESDLSQLEQCVSAGHRSAVARRDVLDRLLDATYRLRDELQDRLAIELRARGRISDVAAHVRVDAEMAIYNRVGFESLLAAYCEKDSANRGPVSIALIDIDRFRRIQQDLGPAQADSLLATFAELAERALRQNRGFDRVARIAGHSFVFFLGNTRLPGAQIVCERVRQQIEAASFMVGQRDLELTISCSAMELRPQQSALETLEQLRAALGEARKAGRNRTCLFDDGQMTVVQPEQMQVTGQSINVPVPKIG